MKDIRGWFSLLVTECQPAEAQRRIARNFKRTRARCATSKSRRFVQGPAAAVARVGPERGSSRARIKFSLSLAFRPFVLYFQPPPSPPLVQRAGTTASERRRRDLVIITSRKMRSDAMITPSRGSFKEPPSRGPPSPIPRLFYPRVSRP